MDAAWGLPVATDWGKTCKTTDWLRSGNQRDAMGNGLAKHLTHWTTRTRILEWDWTSIRRAEYQSAQSSIIPNIMPSPILVFCRVARFDPCFLIPIPNPAPNPALRLVLLLIHSDNQSNFPAS